MQDIISERKSVRTYKDIPISEDDINKILKAGMSGPTAVNSRDWSFIAVTDRETLDKMADGNGGAAIPLKGAPLGILVCGDLERSFSRAPEFWIIDCAIACQNMILKATELGIGSVWLGTWPLSDKVNAQKELFGLPESIVPHSIIAFGYPADKELNTRNIVKPEWEADRVHYQKW